MLLFIYFNGDGFLTFYQEKGYGRSVTFSKSPEWIKAKYGEWITGGVIYSLIVIDCHCRG